MGEEIVKNPFDVWKKRFKRTICATVILMLSGPILLAIGIGLLVKYVEFWGDKDEDLERVLAYVGLGVLLLGILLLAVGILLIVILCIIHSRIDKAANRTSTFRPPAPGQYAPGKAPYPVQAGWTPQGIPGIVPTQQQPSAPLVADTSADSKPPPPSSTNDVHIEITPHTRM